jgi:AraC-like DNA-binding protein
MDAASKYGVVARQLCEGFSVDLSLLDKTDISTVDCRVPFGQLISLYERAAKLTGDDAFGLHVGERTRHKMFDLFGYVLMNCPTLGVALNRAVRYKAMWSNGAVFRLTMGRSQVHFIYEYMDVSAPIRRQECEMTLAATTMLCRSMTQERWNPVEVYFQHAYPKDISEHLRIFRAPVFFSKPTNELVIDRSTLGLPISKADPGLFTVLDCYAGQLVSKLPSCSEFVDHAREVITSTISSGQVSLESTARRLGVSCRTLQRRLQQEGTSVDELIQQIRRELSLLYLRDPNVALSEVAYLLGFAGVSAFHNAFRKWTGKTPTQYRREL